MKVAKATPDEFEPVMKLVNTLDALLQQGRFRSCEEDWREWDDNNPDKQLLLQIEKDLKETEHDEEPDNRLILFEFFKKKWNEANWCGSFGRIIADAAVLIENVCDPDLDYLEYKPEMIEAFKDYNKKHGKEIIKF